MKPTKQILKAAREGHGIIPIGKTGRFWQAFRRPSHQCFKGDIIIDLVAPNKKEWTALWGPGDSKPMIYPNG